MEPVDFKVTLYHSYNIISVIIVIVTCDLGCLVQGLEKHCVQLVIALIRPGKL